MPHHTTRTEITVIGIDIGKNSFHVVGHDLIYRGGRQSGVSVQPLSIAASQRGNGQRRTGSACGNDSRMGVSSVTAHRPQV